MFTQKSSLILMTQFVSVLVANFALTACSNAPAPDSTAVVVSDNPAPMPQSTDIQTTEKLGTKWGDEIQSNSEVIEAERLTVEPIDEKQVRYANKSFQGKSLNDISLVAGKIQFSIQKDNGTTLPLFRNNQAYYLKANAGDSYQLHYHNNSNTTYEIVASVDGLDVLDGSSASRYNNGYILYPNSDLVIEGFRKSQEAVASFTFSKPEDSYANHNVSGSIDNTGIIGMAVYELDLPKKPTKQYATEPTDKPNAFPADK
ncbi:hypothetical protein [Faucicola boevrei]|uniref:hypothetical protein n=1 Tax=Faucicola boevrei TaxID=346665 RepID=UPI00035ECDB6|nr:hypothetical protein [Moraxella boevrei]